MIIHTTKNFRSKMNHIRLMLLTVILTVSFAATADFKNILLLANQGDAIAQNTLGDMYNEGKGVAQDFTEAVRLYKLSANQGNAFAQYNLGNMYSFGKGVAQNLTEAGRLYQLSEHHFDTVTQNQPKLLQNQVTKAKIHEPKKTIVQITKNDPLNIRD